MRDLGGFVLELYRFDKWRADLVGVKLAEVAETDRELRALESVLGEERALREVREAGIGGVCSECGAIHGSVDHFCAACGAPLRSVVRKPRPPPVRRLHSSLLEPFGAGRPLYGLVVRQDDP